VLSKKLEAELLNKLPPLRLNGTDDETPDTAPSPSSTPASSPTRLLAKKMVDQLFGWCQMPDAGDAKVYLAGAVGILSDYPPAVMEAIADPRTGTRVLKDYPTLSDLRQACDELHAPFVREAQRRAAHESHLLTPPPRPPRTPEQQARIDAQVGDDKMRLIRAGVIADEQRDIPQAPLLPPWPTAPMPAERRARLLADLAERQARNEALRTAAAAASPQSTASSSNSSLPSEETP
jgi:hypothetical protein